jgi:hypothetical protein
MCDLARHHVNFIAIRYGDKHISIFSTGIVKRIGVRCAADHCTDVQAIRQSAQLITVGIYDGDIVLFVGQVFSEGAANLPCPENDNLHGSMCSGGLRKTYVLLHDKEINR